MIERFEYSGMWWLPDKDKEQFPGTLRFDPNEGTVLDLKGSFQKIEDAYGAPDPEIILGHVSLGKSVGKNVTLYKCRRIKSNSSYLGQSASTSLFNIYDAFIGVHFKEKEDIRFRKLSIHYSYLDEWVNIHGLNIQPSLDGKEIVIKYSKPESICANIGENYKVSIDFETIDRTFSTIKKGISVKERTYITIEASEEKSYDEFFGIVHQIQKSLSLWVMEPVYPLTIKGLTESNKEERKGEDYYPPVEIYHGLRDIPKVPERLPVPDMVFTFKNISGKFEGFLKNWFEKIDLLEPVYDMYSESLYSPFMSLENKFLNAIHALESYHRRTYCGEYLRVADYKKIRGALVAAIPDVVKGPFKDSLKSRIEFGYEVSLRSRLKEIIEAHRVVFTELIEGKKSFTNTAVDTRNYYVHRLKERKETVAVGNNLFLLTQQLRILLEICLLAELGFGPSEIKSFLPIMRKK